MPSLQLVLVLPDLLRAPGPAGAAPALARILATAGIPTREPDGVGAALAPFYGVARQTDWPFAALRAAALGIDPGADYWLAADPVTLEAGRDDLRLAGAVTDLAPAEATALMATLNAHFAADALAFVAPRPDAWFVRTAAVQALATCPLDAAIGRSLRTRLPGGTDAGRWRRWQSEVQMLLHEHPVNAGRERTGRRPVNSVWFWGGGTRPAPSPRALRSYAAGGLAPALAAHAGAPAAPVPAALDAALAGAGATTTVVVSLDPSGDSGAAERAWAAPAWAALCRGALGAIVLIAGGGPEAVVWTARRPGVRQRLAARLRPPDLAALLASARAAAGER